MPLYLNNDDQARALPRLAEAIDAIENILRRFAAGDAIRRPRIDNYLPTPRPEAFFCFSSMEGGSRAPGYYALRIKPDMISWPVVEGRRRRVTYSYKPGSYGGLVLLYDTDSAEFLAIMNDGYIQHVRVAATGALGAKYMAAPGARVLGIVGSGGMARYFAMAIKAVRPIERIQVYSPNRQRLEKFCAEAAAELGCQVVACASAKEAAQDAAILSLCTSSLVPVIEAAWIAPGTHVTNVRPHELSPEVNARIDAVGLFARRTPMALAGYVDDDFMGVRGDAMAYVGGQPAERDRVPANSPSQGLYPNAELVDCVDWATGEPYRRSRPDLVTTIANISYGILEGEAGASSGIQGLQFAAVGGAIYEGARRLRIGTDLPRDMFLQDTPT